ncbi:MAG: hypothetical protein Q4G07_06720 [Oscillospiraceae bacterium]|nr:hypothetical protein [Oscillospiraceae bacterium]
MKVLLGHAFGRRFCGKGKAVENSCFLLRGNNIKNVVLMLRILQKSARQKIRRRKATASHVPPLDSFHLFDRENAPWRRCKAILFTYGRF